MEADNAKNLCKGGGGMAKDKLTGKQKAFVENMKANGGNALKAARDAGYSHPRSSAEDNVKNPYVQAALQKEGETIAKRKKIQADDLIDELMPIITYSTSDFIRMGDEGELTLVKDAINDPIRSKAIKQMRQTQYGVEIVFHDKIRANEIVARMIGADQPKQEEAQTVRVVFDDGLEELMENG